VSLRSSIFCKLQKLELYFRPATFDGHLPFSSSAARAGSSPGHSVAPPFHSVLVVYDIFQLLPPPHPPRSLSLSLSLSLSISPSLSLRTVSWGRSSSMSYLPEADCSHGSLSTAPDDNDAEEVAEENVFVKAAQRRRIRHSVTANQRLVLPPHALRAMTMSIILSRCRGSTFSAASSGSADDSVDCSAE